MIGIVLIEPSVPGNIGAIARVMQNFGCTELTLVNPKCDYLSKEAQDRAKHAKKILQQARTVKTLKETQFDYLIATTSQLGKDYNITRLPILPEQLKKILPKKGKTAIVLGREGEGLHNEEIRQCDFLVTIPTSKKHPTMNVSHSAAIILYETFQGEHTASHITPATKQDKERLLNEVDKALERMKLNNEKKQKYKKIWKHMIGKYLPKREAMALFGFIKKIR